MIHWVNDTAKIYSTGVTDATENATVKNNAMPFLHTHNSRCSTNTHLCACALCTHTVRVYAVHKSNRQKTT